MSDLRDSYIHIHTENFKEEEAKLNIILRVDFSKSQCDERMQKIKELGIEPSNNAVVITHEFSSEEAAQEMVTKLNNFKDTMGNEMGPFADLWEVIKADGNRLIVCFRFSPDATATTGMLDPIAASLGDITTTNQFIEARIASVSNLKEIVTTQSQSPMAALLAGVSIKLSLAAHKDLPLKLTEFAANMVPEYEKKSVLMAGKMATAFNHLKLDIELREPTEAVKEAYKSEMIMGLMSAAQFACGMAEQFGFMEVAKTGGAQTVAMLCLSPIVSVQFTLYAPTAIEALEKAANPM